VNSIHLVGRLVEEPTITYTDTGLPVAKFRVAVNRPVKKDERGSTPADFFRVTAFRKSAEFIAQYGHQGDLVAVEGSVQTDVYTDRDNVKRYSWGVVANRVQHLAKKGANGNGKAAAGASTEQPPADGPAAPDPDTDGTEGMDDPF
jgi:single-strand DNA-binding protein